MRSKREVWVDNVKVIACILVVLGHFFQSMHKSSVLEASSLHDWFDMTIYYFHVPLFFICSGYLYQKNSMTNSFEAWKANVLKKLIALGIPYFVFSFATWVLKKAFASSTNDDIGGLFETLFLKPTPPYWYLYVLFFIYIITLTINGRKCAIVLLSVSLLCKVLGICGKYSGIYAIDKILDNWIWVVCGMLLAEGYVYLVKKWTSIILGIFFVVLSILKYKEGAELKGINFLLGLLACYSIICFMSSVFSEKDNPKAWAIIGKYTMPVFLMHTLFAASIRSLLLKLGILSAPIHIIVGIVVSFCGPVVAMIIMEKLSPMDFLVYPRRYIKI